MDQNNVLKSVRTYWPMGIGVEIDRPTQTTSELDWTHEDRLGSVVGITEQSGKLKEGMAFDAWGSRRNTNGSPVAYASPQVTEGTDNKGFTGQEMLDQLELVHFNGRLYDPLIGKFLSGDPLVSDPTNGQNYNRYSYVLNNPTNVTDPTGFSPDPVEGPPPPPPPPPPEACKDDVAKCLKNATKVKIYLEDGRVIEVEKIDASSNGSASTRQRGASIKITVTGTAHYGLGYYAPTLPEWVNNASGGFGDELLVGQGERLRKMLNIQSVDMESGAYAGGEVAGAVTLIFVGGAAGAEAAGTRSAGMEFSHSFPARYFREFSLSGRKLNPEYKPLLNELFGWAKDTILNGNYRTAAEHYLEDPFRFPRGWRELGPRYPDFLQSLSRIPNVFKGLFGGGVAAGAGPLAAPAPVPTNNNGR